MELISLASGASYFNTPAPASEAALRAIQQHKTFYGSVQGTENLRTALANRYRTVNSTTVSPDQILITPGTKFALYTILRQLVKPGDEVVVPVPNWPGFHEVLQLLGAKLVFLPTTLEDNYTLRPETVKQLITPKTRLFLFSNPVNPTGRIIRKHELEALVAVLQDYPDIYVLADEIYDLVTFGERVPSLAELPDPNGRHVVVNGFSKSFAMSGWRIGYLVLPPALLPGCLHFQDTTFSGVSEFIQAAAEAAISRHPEVLEPLLTVFRHNRELVTSFLKSENIPCFFPEAAYYVFPDFSCYFTEDVPDAIAFTRFLHQQYGLEIRPGDHYGAPGFARLSFAIETAALKIALDRLKEAIIHLK